MKIHHLRNATLIIETVDQVILVDPMLGEPATLSPFTLFRFPAKKNPLVPLPENTHALLDKVTHCLITHKHPDHIDQPAEVFLKEGDIPVACSVKDAAFFRKKGLNVDKGINYWEKSDYLEGTIMGIPARHGYGFIAKPMGNVMGYYIELPDLPSIYISSDTIYTADVDRALKELQPDLTVVACGTAQLDFGKPLLMTLDDITTFVRNSPKMVIANHMEALNHCPTTRKQLRDRLTQEGLIHKAYIPEDGTTIAIEA